MADRAPGPIAVSDSLLATLAEYRQWHVLIADAEPRDPWVKALELPTELSPEAVADVEAALDASLSDAVLGVLASRVPHLEDQYEMRLDNFAALSGEAWRAGLPRELLAVARDGEALVCVPRREHAWAATVVTAWRPTEADEKPRGLQRWLMDGPMTELWGHLIELGVIEQDADDPPPHGRALSGPGLVPRLAVPKVVAEAAAVRVQHAKFGVGRVLRSIGEGDGRKLDIDFGPGGGVRTILARFVTELP